MLAFLLSACLAATPEPAPAPTASPATADSPSTGARTMGKAPPLQGWEGNSSSLVVAAGQKHPDHVAFATKSGAKTEIISDPNTFALIWSPSKPVKGVIVTLHGSKSYAYTELQLWEPYAEEHSLGIVALQWWDGMTDERQHYLPPRAAYDLVSDLVHRHFGDKPGPVILHGFSRGSSNSYSVVAWDRLSGAPFITGVISNAGGYQADYPPNQRIDQGNFGAKPYDGVKWVVACGTEDPRPDMDGCPAMSRAKTWLEGKGAKATLIEVQGGDHGGFQNDHAAVEKALDALL